LKQQLWIYFGQGNVLVYPLRVIHIQDACGNLLSCCGLPAPLCALYEHSALSCQLSGKQLVCYSLLGDGAKLTIYFHNSDDWRIFIRMIGGIPFG